MWLEMCYNILFKLNSVYIESTSVEIKKRKQQDKLLQKSIISKLIIKFHYRGLFLSQQNIIT